MNVSSHAMRPILSFFLLFMLGVVPRAGAALDIGGYQLIPPEQYSISYSRAVFDRRSGNTSYTATVRNIGSGGLTGPVYMLIQGVVPASASIVNGDDITAVGDAAFLVAGAAGLLPGQAVNVSLVWEVGSRDRIKFGAVLYGSKETDAPVIDSFNASLTSILAGQSVQLSWEVTGASLTTIAPSVGEVVSTGSIAVTPAESTTYILTASKGAASVSSEVRVNVTQPVIVKPRALPEEGFAPLNVRFIPELNTTTAINYYYWDLDGNGSFERSDTVGRDQSYYYRSPGEYRVGLRVIDSQGNEEIGYVTVSVKNAPPEVVAGVSSTNGTVPFTAIFDGVATDSDGIALYEWDFDGDGTYDYSGASIRTSYSFNTVGQYTATLRVTDRLGASTVVQAPSLDIIVVPEGDPTVVMTRSPASGNAPLSVSFDAVGDGGNGTIVDWAWDFDGDGAVDSNTAPPVSHVYSGGGLYFPSVTISTDEAKSAADTKPVDVNASGNSLSIVDHTIDPGLSQTSRVDTVLAGEATATLYIENASGQIVRQLVQEKVRSAGSYSDFWDGTNDNGQQVADGQYFALLRLTNPGYEQVVDLRLTTGGRQYNPPRTRIPSRFSPFDNDPLVIDFTLSRPAEVTSFMGLFRTNTRLRTFHQREPMGAGTHTVVWNSDDPTGKPIPPVPGNEFLFGIWAYEYAYNVIYVQSVPEISALKILPSILNPGSRTDTNDGQSHSAFNLSKDADIELVVSDADAGVEVANIIYPGRDAGDIELVWDGKNNDGEFVAPGNYRIGVRAIDAIGNRSMYVYGMQRIYY